MSKKAHRLYSILEGYKLMYKAFKSMKIYSNASKSNLISKDFSERIMLAVTDVNGCAMCSYAHTKMALEAGLNGDEIKNLLAGAFDDVPSEELVAIMYAQHFAETRGLPSKKSKEDLIDTYGIAKSNAISASINIIMMGNAYGIPLGSLLSRFMNNQATKRDSRSNPFYEIFMLLSVVVF
ncbi:MAG: carboxymuconolactone decarboxylase family protein, partial [Spirochaetaceae bacterium]|nr:carboxymuconolactone decarboxylase family protein [Spirochaetaceae bacterium]